MLPLGLTAIGRNAPPMYMPPSCDAALADRPATATSSGCIHHRGHAWAGAARARTSVHLTPTCELLAKDLMRLTRRHRVTAGASPVHQCRQHQARGSRGWLRGGCRACAPVRRHAPARARVPPALPLCGRRNDPSARNESSPQSALVCGAILRHHPPRGRYLPQKKHVMTVQCRLLRTPSPRGPRQICPGMPAYKWLRDRDAAS